jgi:hypothetical protein
MEGIQMKSITEKAFLEIAELEEKTSIDPNTKYSTANTNPKQLWVFKPAIFRIP